jgi:hypothetical protein
MNRKRIYMKNQLLLLILITFAFSCKKVDVKQEKIVPQVVQTEPPALATTTNHIGDPNRTPNLYIPEDEPGWLGYTKMGLYSAYKRLETKDTGVVLAYDCVIANGIKNATSFTDFDTKLNGQPRDFVVCRPCDGVVDQYETNTYDFPGMLAITLFKDGQVVTKKLKQQFWVENNRERVNFPWSSQHYYGNDTMYIFWGAGDDYFNRIQVPTINGVPVTGKYVVKVEVNPDKLITESNYKDNYGFLPVSINGMTVVTDTTALQNQAPKTAQWIEYKLLKGKVKGISLKWSNVNCENYCIEKNGAMIKVWYNDTSYIDPTGHRGDTYRIRSNNWGLGNVFNNPVIVAR